MSQNKRNMVSAKLLRVARKIRTFDPVAFTSRHPYGVYYFFCSFLYIGYNYRLQKNLKRLYPDYNVVANSSGKQYADAKVQELADIRRYNNNVDRMRQSMRDRG